MNSDILIFKALISKQNDLLFQDKIIENDLVSIYNGVIKFYLVNRKINIPYIATDNTFENTKCENILFEQNTTIFQHYIILFVAISFFISFGLYYSAITVPYTILGLLFCLGVGVFNVNCILKAQQIKNVYNDLLNAIIINILDYIDCIDKKSITEEDLLLLLLDIKNSHNALSKARECGYLLQETNIFEYTKNKSDIKEELSTWDNESNSIDKISKSA